MQKENSQENQQQFAISNVVTAIQDINSGVFVVTGPNGELINVAQIMGDVLQSRGQYTPLGMTTMKIGGVDTLIMSIHFFVLANTPAANYFIKIHSEKIDGK